jgi:hypothetical protein
MVEYSVYSETMMMVVAAAVVVAEVVMVVVVVMVTFQAGVTVHGEVAGKRNWW